jgi:hypothetical protein
MDLSEKQRGVLIGMAGAAILSVVLMGAAVALAPSGLVPVDTVESRLSLVLRWDLLVVVWLLVAIGNLARHRFFTPQDIDGSGLTAGSEAARIHQAVLQNTLEQVVLALTVHTIAAFLLPVSWVAAVPAAAILFACGRLLFWRGYRGGAAARAAGFALTFYPTVLLFLAVASAPLWAG